VDLPAHDARYCDLLLTRREHLVGIASLPPLRAEPGGSRRPARHNDLSAVDCVRKPIAQRTRSSPIWTSTRCSAPPKSQDGRQESESGRPQGER